MDLSKDEETLKQQVWLEAWVNTARADNCVKADTPTKYADACLKDFEERFINS